jgi:ribonuclease-3
MDLSHFFNQFNIQPTDERMYMQALTHRSYVHQKRKSKRDDQQERLEFFGDAVLKFVVSYFLMHRFPLMEEGMLTKIRARIISDRSLAKLGLQLNLDQYVLVSDSEKAFNGQQRPALLADTFEAILGALFLDKGSEYTLEWFAQIIDDYMSEYLDVDFIVDYKTFLQELVQKQGAPLPVYDCVKMTGPEHKKTFHYQVNVTIGATTYDAIGYGENKKVAQQAAAKCCVEKLKNGPLQLNR